MLTIIQTHILINQFNNLSINQKIQMASPIVNYVIIPFKRNVNPGDPQGLKLYLQAAKEIDKESENLDISVSNAKNSIDHFLSLANKYGRGRFELMVDTGAVAKNIFR